MSNISQTFSLQDKVPHHEYLKLSSMILCGIYVFFVVERIMKMIFDWKEVTISIIIAKEDNHAQLEKSETIRH